MTAAVERGPSEGARSGSKESSSRPCAVPSKLARYLSGMEADWSPTARVQRGPSQAARCASTEDHQPPSSPLFCEQEGHLAALPIPPSSLAVSQGWGLIDLPLRASRNPDAKQAGRMGLTQRGGWFGLYRLSCWHNRQTRPANQRNQMNESDERRRARRRSATWRLDGL